MAFFHPNFFLQSATPSHQEDDYDNGDHNHSHNRLSGSLSHPLHQLPPPCTPQEFHGVASFLGKRPSMPFPTTRMDEDVNNAINNHGEEELSDDGSQMGEKKRRLNMEQVRTLEKNFELAKKLEPERKMQLARALGLQPRQVAIWFQNRRARWKTKKLEKDYDALKRQFEAVKAENEALEARNNKLHAQIEAMKKTTAREPTDSINLNRLDIEGSSSSNRSNEEVENTSQSDEIVKRTKEDNNNDDDNSPSMLLFPSSLQLNFQNSSSSSRPEIQCPKIDHHHHHHHHHQNGKEENLCNMFCGVDDQTGFWPWLEHQHFS